MTSEESLELIQKDIKEAITVSTAHREFVKKQRWSANVARTFEQSAFNEGHIICTLKMPQKALFSNNVLAASTVIHTCTYTHYTL